jgi:hypothetical protein
MFGFFSHSRTTAVFTITDNNTLTRIKAITRSYAPARTRLILLAAPSALLTQPNSFTRGSLLQLRTFP